MISAEINYEVEAEQIVEKIIELSKSDKWQFSKKVDSVDYYEIKDDVVVLGKGEGIIESDVETIFSYLDQNELKRQVDPMFVKNEDLVIISDQVKIIRQVYSANFPVQGRDFVLLATKQYRGDTLLACSKSVSDSFYPIDKDYVRGNCHIAGWILEQIEPNKVKAQFIFKIDPKGLIPKILTNKAQSVQVKIIISIDKVLKQKKNQTNK